MHIYCAPWHFSSKVSSTSHHLPPPNFSTNRTTFIPIPHIWDLGAIRESSHLSLCPSTKNKMVVHCVMVTDRVFTSMRLLLGWRAQATPIHWLCITNPLLCLLLPPCRTLITTQGSSHTHSTKAEGILTGNSGLRFSCF